MKKLMWTGLMVAAMMMVISCGDKADEQTATEKAVEGAKEIAEKATEMTKVAVEEGKEVASKAMAWSKDKMDEYIGKMGEKLNGFSGKFGDLTTKGEGLSGDAKDTFNKQLETLTDKKEEAASAFEALKGSSAETWAAAKEKFDTVMKELVALYEEIVASLKE